MMLTRTATLLLLCAAMALGRSGPPCKAPPLGKTIRVPLPVAEVLFTEAEIDRMLQSGFDFKEIDDPKAALGDVLSRFKSEHRLNDLRFISSPRFEADGVVDPMDLIVGKYEGNRRTVEEHLKQILARAPGANFLIRRGHIEITTDNAIRKELMLPKKGPLPPLLRYMRIDDETVEKACEKIAAKLGATIVLDPRASQEANTKITATFRNVPLPAALELIGDMSGMVVVRRANGFCLTSAKNKPTVTTASP